MLDQPIENRQAVRSHDELMVFSAKVLRDGAGVLQFVELRLVEPDRERLHGRGRGLCHQPDNDARVHAARKECPERHVADHVRAHRIGQDAAQCRRRFLFVTLEALGSLHFPVLRQLGPSFAPSKQMSGRELADVPENRAVTRRVQKGQVVIEGFEVDLAVDRAGGDERFDFGPEVEPSVPLCVVQRLDP